MAVTARRKFVHRRREEARVERVATDRNRWSNTTVQPCSLAVVPASSSKPTPRHRKPFLSISMSLPNTSSKSEQQGNAQHIATIASGSTATAAPPGVPGWRVSLGNLAAGATAGATVEAVLYPIDTIKTRLQAMRAGGGIKALLQQGGGKALYAGVGGNLVGVVPSSALFMAVYEPVKQAIMGRVSEDRSYLGPIGGGAAAGLVSSAIRVPTEVIKQRMQTGEFTRAVQAIRTIVAREGARGLYAGYGSFLLRDLPFDAIEFVVYEQLKKAVKVAKKGVDPTPLETSAIGATAGAVTGLVTTPLDVIKTRLMIQGTNKTYKGVLDCAGQIMQQEGTSALFRGWEPRVIWIGIGGCVFFTALEEAMKLFIPKPPKPCCAGK